MAHQDGIIARLIQLSIERVAQGERAQRAPGSQQKRLLLRQSVAVFHGRLQRRARLLSLLFCHAQFSFTTSSGLKRERSSCISQEKRLTALPLWTDTIT